MVAPMVAVLLLLTMTIINTHLLRLLPDSL